MKNSGQDPEISNVMQRLVREGTLIAYSLLALFLLKLFTKRPGLYYDRHIR
ncbi:hypothetical protein N9329_03230 [Gammaproteobacteria bacterium]|nr:hypothetical protein [Gammaproteobacteria bacterium]